MAVKTSNANKISKKNGVTRFITTLISYLFLLISSSLVVHFAFKRGNPVWLEVLYCFALLFNIAQIIISIVNFSLKNCGIYNKKLVKVEDSMLIAWTSIIVIEFITACIIFNMFRLDSFLISIVQISVLLIMLIYNKKIDYLVNHSKVKDREKNDLRNPSNLKRRTTTKTLLYFSVCVVVFMVELVALVLPMLPPRVDDIFAEERLLNYTYLDNIDGREDGYYVTDMYLGSNDKIVVPKTYNNKPVVGINTNAINDKGIINSIQLGEYNANGVLESNLKYIDTDAIHLDNIKEIKLPKSLEVLGENAIEGNNVRVIETDSDCALRKSNFGTKNLTTLNLRNEQATVNLDIDNFNVDVHVPLSLYNSYREQYYDNRQLLQVDEKNNNIIVNFETNCKIHIESKFLNDDVASLNITDLKNHNEETNAFINDTALYNSDPHSCEGYLARQGYAFRGWYRDSEFTTGMECTFNDKDKVYFSEDTTLYAKWEIIRVAELDWNNYYPYDEAYTQVKFTDTKSIDLPRFKGQGGEMQEVNRAGYNNIYWTCGDKKIESTSDLADVEGTLIKVKANWMLNKPSISYATLVNGTTYGENQQPDFTFKEDQIIRYVVQFAHELPDIKFNIRLKNRTADGTYVLVDELSSPGNGVYNYDFRDHISKESGHYLIEVESYTKYGETAVSAKNYDIIINKRALEEKYPQLKNHIVAPQQSVYDGTNRQYNYEFWADDIVRTDTYVDAAGKDVPEMKNTGDYFVKMEFTDVGVEKNNYTSAIITSNYSITPKPITALWNYDGIVWNSQYKATYNGQAQILRPIPIGVCGEDRVEFILNNGEDAPIDSGNYSVEITGIDNANYEIDPSTIKTHSFEIMKRPLALLWQPETLNTTYNGKVQSAILHISGFKNDDNQSFDNAKLIREFEIDADCNYSLGIVTGDSINIDFNAIDTNIYNIKVNKLTNKNYTIANTVKDFTINQRELTGHWEDKNNNIYNKEKNYVYNREDQGIAFHLDNVCARDGIHFADGDFNAVNGVMVNNSTKDKSDISFVFNGRNAKEYSVQLEFVNNNKYKDNYRFTTVANSFVIEKLPLEVTWSDANFVYDSQPKTVTAEVTNDGTDNVKLTYDSQTQTKASNGKKYVTKIVSCDNANYSIPKNPNFEWEIQRKPISVKTENDNLVYNGQYQQFSVVLSDIVSSDLVTLDSRAIDFNLNSAPTLQQVSSSVVGDNYVATFKAIDAYPYNIIYRSFNAEVLSNYEIKNQEFNFVINRRPLEYHWKCKNGEKELIYNRQNQGVVPVFDNLCTRVDTDMLDTVANDVSGNQYVNAGEYTAHIDAIYNKNYILPATDNGASADYVWQIKPLPLVVEWPENKNLVYTSFALHPEPIADNLNGDKVTLQYTYAQDAVAIDSPIDVGTYTATISGLEGYDSANYVLSNTGMDVVYDIVPYALEVNTTIESFEYDGYYSPLFVVNFTNFRNRSEADIFANNTDISREGYGLRADVSSNAISYTYSATKAGEYRLSIDGRVNKNYTFKSINKNSSIRPRLIEIYWPNHAPYVYDGTVKNFMPTIANIASNDSASLIVNCTGKTEAGENTQSIRAVDAGQYTVDVIGVNNKNYTLNNGVLATQNTTHQYSIQRRKISLVKDLATPSLVYNGASQGIYVRVGNIVAKDNELFKALPVQVSNLGDNIQYSLDESSSTGTIRITAVNAGVYQYRIEALTSQFDKSNYMIDPTTCIADGEYTIEKAPLSVTWNANSYIYDGDTHSVVANIHNLYFNTKSNTQDEISFTYTNNAKINADTYVATINNQVMSNYTMPVNASHEWTITPKRLTVNYNFVSKIYDGQYSDSSVTIDGFAPKDMSLMDVNSIVSDAQYVSSESVSSPLSVTDMSKEASSMTLLFKYIDTGTYDYAIRSINNSNYSLASTNNRFVIERRQLTMEWGNTEFEYDSEKKTLTYNIVPGLVVNRADTDRMDEVILKVKNTSATNAGQYKAYVGNISGAQAKHYVLAPNTECIWNIKKHRITAQFTNIENFIYDSNEHIVSLMLTGFYGEDQEGLIDMRNIMGTHSVGGVIRKSSGMANVEFSIRDAKKYVFDFRGIDNINYYADPLYAEVVVSPKALNVVKSTQDTFIYDGTSQGVSITVRGVCNADRNDAQNRILVKGAKKILPANIDNGITFVCSSVEAGGYNAAVVNDVTNRNYTMPMESVDFVIKSKVLHGEYIMPEAKDNYYDGTARVVKLKITGISPTSPLGLDDFYAPRGYVSIAECQKNDSTSVTLTYTGIKDVGTYKYSAKLNTKNYVLDIADTTYEIAKGRLAVSNGAQHSSEYAYNGAYQGNDILIKGFATSAEAQNAMRILNQMTFTNDVQLFISTAQEELGNTYYVQVQMQTLNVGEKSLVINQDLGANYEPISIHEVYSIAPASLHVVLATTPKTYIYNGTNQGRIITIEGFASQADASQAISGLDNIKIDGEYGEYVNISSSSKKVYIDYKCTNVVNNRTITFDKQIIHSNYAPVEFEDSFSITKAKIVGIKSNGGIHYVYDGMNKTNTIEIPGFKSEVDANNAVNVLKRLHPTNNGVHYSVNSMTYTISITYPAIDVGHYTYTLSNESINGNYENITINDSYDITPKELQPISVVGNTSYTYDGASHGLVITISGFSNRTETSSACDIVRNNINVSTSDVTITPTDNAIEIRCNAINVGTYNISLINCTVDKNYKPVTFMRQFSIDKGTLSVTPSTSTNVTYDGAEHEKRITIKGFCSLDESRQAISVLEAHIICDVPVRYLYDSTSVTIVYARKEIGSSTLISDGVMILTPNYADVQILKDMITIDDVQK